MSINLRGNNFKITKLSIDNDKFICDYECKISFEKFHCLDGAIIAGDGHGSIEFYPQTNEFGSASLQECDILASKCTIHFNDGREVSCAVGRFVEPNRLSNLHALLEDPIGMKILYNKTKCSKEPLVEGQGSEEYIFEELINNAIHKEDFNGLTEILKVAYYKNKLPYIKMLSLLSQGDAETLRECNYYDNPIKSDPIICTFVMREEFEFYPPPVPKCKPSVSFEGYVEKRAHCRESLESFKECELVFCHDYPQSCVGKSLPPYEAFDQTFF